MQKKLLAVAMAGALGAPALALAQSSTVQIFGTVYMEYGYGKQGQPANGVAPFNSRQNIDVYGNPGSEIGFKGEEKLGGGLSAWFQCSATMNWLDAGNGNGGDDDGLLCSRNSGLGLKGGFGNLFVGRWDTPFKRTISPTNVGGNDTGIWGTAFLLTGGSTSTTAGTARSTFKRREGNTLFYDSPSFAGFQVMAAVSSGQGPNGGITGTAATSGLTASKPRTMSIGAQYSAGPIYVSAGYEKHKEVAGNGGDNDDKGWHVGASYVWGPVRFGGQYTQQKFDFSGASAAGIAGIGAGVPTGSSEAKYRAWHVGVDWNIVGPHGLRAAYTKALDAKGNATVVGGATSPNTLITGTYRPAPCFGTTFATRVCGDTGAEMWQIRYVYTFSKRTEFTAGFSRTENDGNAAYVPNILSTPQTGEKTTFYAVGLRHTF